MLRGAAGEAGDLNQAMEVIHGVPMRDPTAYRPLAEFCLAIPDEQFWNGAFVASWRGACCAAAWTTQRSIARASVRNAPTGT